MADKSLFSIPLDEVESFSANVEEALQSAKDMVKPLQDVRDLLKSFAPAVDPAVASMKNLVSETGRFRLESKVALDTWNVIASRVDRMASVLRSLPSGWGSGGAGGGGGGGGGRAGSGGDGGLNFTGANAALGLFASQLGMAITAINRFATALPTSMGSSAPAAVALKPWQQPSGAPSSWWPAPPTPTQPPSSTPPSRSGGRPSSGKYADFGGVFEQLSKAKTLFTSGGAGSEAAASLVPDVLKVLKGGKFETLLGATATIATAITAVGASGIAAVIKMAPDVAGLRMQGLGLGGVSASQLRAARAAGSWETNAEGTLGNIVNARRDIGSQAFSAMAVLFGQGARGELQKPEGETQFDILNKMVEKLGQFPEEIRDTMFKSMGFGALTDITNYRAWEKFTPGERAERQASWNKVTAATKMSDEDQKTWFDFYDKIKTSGQILEFSIQKKLTPLAGPLGDLADQITKFAQTDVFDDLIKKFARFLNSKDFKDDVDYFTQQIKISADQISTIITTLKPFMAVADSFTIWATGWLAAHEKAAAGSIRGIHVWVGKKPEELDLEDKKRNAESGFYNGRQVGVEEAKKRVQEDVTKYKTTPIIEPWDQFRRGVAPRIDAPGDIGLPQVEGALSPHYMTDADRQKMRSQFASGGMAYDFTHDVGTNAPPGMINQPGKMPDDISAIVTNTKDTADLLKEFKDAQEKALMGTGGGGGGGEGGVGSMLQARGTGGGGGGHGGAGRIGGPVEAAGGGKGAEATAGGGGAAGTAGSGGGPAATGGGAGGSGAGAKMSDYSPAQRTALLDAMQKHEGYFPGSRSYRNNNPGNIEYGDFAKAHGATGSDGRFAIFPSYQAGRSAQEKLLFESPGYKDLTLGKAIARWAPGMENNVPAYIKTMEGALGGANATGGGKAGAMAGVGDYNFMGSARARALGMGDVTPGGPLSHMSFATGIEKGKGPQTITANKYAGSDIAGFLKDLSDAGAPLKNFAGVYANRPMRSGGPSQHSYGNAVDLETGFGSGPDNSPALYAWAQAHPKEFADIQAKHNMRNLDTSSGAHMHDWGHFEWTPTGRKTDNAADVPAADAGAVSDLVSTTKAGAFMIPGGGDVPLPPSKPAALGGAGLPLPPSRPHDLVASVAHHMRLASHYHHRGHHRLARHHHLIAHHHARYLARKHPHVVAAMKRYGPGGGGEYDPKDPRSHAFSVAKTTKGYEAMTKFLKEQPLMGTPEGQSPAIGSHPWAGEGPMANPPDANPGWLPDMNKWVNPTTKQDINYMVPRKRAVDAPQTDMGQQARAASSPLGIGNWQLAHRSSVELRNQTGSDVFINAGGLAT